MIGTDDPDLSAFRKAGGKVLIVSEGTIDYDERPIGMFHSAEQVQWFARLFMALCRLRAPLAPDALVPS